jgi:hypothetical protein
MRLINRKIGGARLLSLASLSLLTLSPLAQAQTFTSAVNDLFLGFRKDSPYTENYEVVVDVGQASNYCSLAVGTTIPVPGYTTTQLGGSFVNFNNLSWSVVGAYSGSSYPGYVNNTLWVTVPRANNALKSVDATRLGFGAQQVVKAKINSLISANGGAGYISQNLGSSSFNTASFVREPILGYGSQILTYWMQSSIPNSTAATLNDTWPASEPSLGNLEVTTPGSFSGSVRADLYEVRPVLNAAGNNVTDPHTGTNSIAWYVGYFQFNSDGSMTFTRDVPRTTLSISRPGGVTTISFPTYSYVTYTLWSESSLVGGLWAMGSTTNGDGTVKSFQDSTSTPPVYYKVQEQ